MKHSAKCLSGIVLGLILVLLSVPSHADNTKKVKVTIPFDFLVGNKQLKSGDYVVESLGAAGGGALLFRSIDGNTRQIVFAVPVETNKTGNHERLVFHRYGSKQFAIQVWFMGDDEGYELIPGTREEESAANHAAADQVVAGQYSTTSVRQDRMGDVSRPRGGAHPFMSEQTLDLARSQSCFL